MLCAAPEYLKKHGTPRTPDDLLSDEHNCLLLRYPRSPEYYWVLQTPAGPRKLQVSGKMDADHGDVLTDWALSGYGIVNKPRFDVAQHLESGRLVEILKDTPPPHHLRLPLSAQAPSGPEDPPLRGFRDQQRGCGRVGPDPVQPLRRV